MSKTKLDDYANAIDENGVITFYVWVDDVRPAPDSGWYVCRSVNEAIFTFGRLAQISNLLGCRWEVIFSLDHDAGEYACDGGDFIKLLDAMEHYYEWAHTEHKEGDDFKIHFHSANPVGVENMRRIVEHCPWLTEVKDEDLD